MVVVNEFIDAGFWCQNLFGKGRWCGNQCNLIVITVLSDSFDIGDVPYQVTNASLLVEYNSFGTFVFVFCGCVL